jgi:predicted ATPase/class 3 adenylate cyclase
MVEPLPEGVVTFVFSDVEGSTRLAKGLGDARWAELLDVHRRILREAFSAQGGREVDTQGDAFFVVFTRATDAVAAALEGQRALEEHPWPAGGRVRVRIGLHTGEALARGDRYVGQEVHRASRICAAAHGGQIVVSRTTADLVGESLPGDATLTDLGEHRLKDLGDAQRLFQLASTGLASAFPRLRSLDAPHNLPAERSSFVGREKEIAGIRRLLVAHRLVTLTGIGGSGKTRLALQVGALELGAFPDGVFFVDLGPVGDPDLAAQAIASTIGLSSGDAMSGLGGSLDDRLVASLARRKCLLLVDNCEHLLDTVAGLVDRILAGCSRVVVLATSREALGVEGEQIVQVPSLTVPGVPSDADDAEAVRLFVDRATAVKPGFELGAENRAPVVEICRRLDGIPLAIEFAATRVAHLSPQQIADRLEDRFRLLTGARRRIQRQQTLAAALDWSHDLLSEEERVVFRRLAVFAGGFSLNAAEAVSAGDGISAGAVLDLLGSLVAKSLVTTAEGDRGGTRYRLLETVRMYASEKLAAAGEADAARSRHCDWYVGWIDATPFERLTFAPEALRAVEGDVDNLRAAADWALASDRPDVLARFVSRLFTVWWLGGSYAEGHRRLLEVLKYGDRVAPDDRVGCHAILAVITTMELERGASLDHAKRAIDLAAGRPSPFLVIAIVMEAFGTSVLAVQPGADARLAADARREIGAAVAVARSGLPVEWLAFAENYAAMIETTLGDIPAAARMWTALVETCGFARDPGWLMPAALSGVAVSQHLLGETAAALRAAEGLRALPDPRDSPLKWLQTIAIEAVPALVAGGREAIACAVLRDAARDVRRLGLGIPMAENHLLSIVAVVEHLRGRPERAGRLLAAARYLGGAADLPIPFRSPASWALYRHYLPRVRAALGPDESRRARDEGRAMTLDEALAYAVEGLG